VTPVAACFRSDLARFGEQPVTTRTSLSEDVQNVKASSPSNDAEQPALGIDSDSRCSFAWE